MGPLDTILGHVLVERGWLASEELSHCLEAAAGISGAPCPLSQVILERRLVPPDELATLKAEISLVLERGTDDRERREDDAWLGQFLLSAGQLSKEHWIEARTAQSDPDGTKVVPRLAQILLERGFTTLAAIQDALHSKKAPSTSVTCRSCKAAYVVVRYDPDRVYLCRTCTGELVSADRLELEAEAGIADVLKGPPGEFGRYTGATEIGRGGMGVVYKAYDGIHQRWVALKVIKDTGRLEDLARFRREVEIVRALHHPNIVALYDVTHLDSRHLVAMEYVDGTTLGSRRLAPARAAALVAIVARAVQYAHSRGIIHRDIKPQNIMIDRAGKPYLMDFGLAKTAEVQSSVTSVGTVMGTPSYMAPEQAIGRSSRVDRRTDIYSLGALLYHLLTGRPPFQGANPLDTLRKVMQDPLVPPSDIDPDVPRPLEEIALRCLDKDKNRRPPTARHLAEALERYVSGVAR